VDWLNCIQGLRKSFAVRWNLSGDLGQLLTFAPFEDFYEYHHWRITKDYFSGYVAASYTQLTFVADVRFLPQELFNLGALEDR